MAVDIENDFEPTYEALPDRKRIIDELIKAAKGCRYGLSGLDPDREGEAIAWHISRSAQLKERPVASSSTKSPRPPFKAPSLTRAISIWTALTPSKPVAFSTVSLATSSRRSWPAKSLKALSAGRVQSWRFAWFVNVNVKSRLLKSKSTGASPPYSRRLNKEFPFPAILRTIDGKKSEISDEATATGLVDESTPQLFVVQTSSSARRSATRPLRSSPRLCSKNPANSCVSRAQRTMRSLRICTKVSTWVGAPRRSYHLYENRFDFDCQRSSRGARQLISNRFRSRVRAR